MPDQVALYAMAPEALIRHDKRTGRRDKYSGGKKHLTHSEEFVML
jgi:hypothetical protein